MQGRKVIIKGEEKNWRGRKAEENVADWIAGVAMNEEKEKGRVEKKRREEE